MTEDTTQVKFLLLFFMKIEFMYGVGGCVR